MTDEHDFRIRLGRSGDAGEARLARSPRLAAEVRRAAASSGLVSRGIIGGRGTGRHGRGRIARLRLASHATHRRVVIKARVVRHVGARFRAAPLARHIAYLRRDGVTRDGVDASLFDSEHDGVSGSDFADRCEDDRHHFRFIVSPEDAGELEDLRGFARDLMRDVSEDLGSRLDWVAVDHWNTDNPHLHILVRGVADDGRDLVIDRDYIREGMRSRAQDLATLELGPRSAREIRLAIENEVAAEHWTGLDRTLERLADPETRIVDLRPGGGDDRAMRRLLLGRAATLERFGVAEKHGAACWHIAPDAEAVMRDVSIRTDIIKTMHRALAGDGRHGAIAELAIHDTSPSDPVLGRLVARGLHDELAGTAYALVDGVDGRHHHLTFSDLEASGDAAPGAIVETRAWHDRRGRSRTALMTRSDLPLEAQVAAPGATWLDRQLVARAPAALEGEFGTDVENALRRRADHLAASGLAERVAGGLRFADNLIDTLQARELAAARAAIAARTGLEARQAEPGEFVSGIYRERVALASGRFAMIDDGLGFQLVPWRPALDARLGAHVTGTMGTGGSVDWALGRGRGRSL